MFMGWVCPMTLACGDSPSSEKTFPWNLEHVCLASQRSSSLLVWCAQCACLQRFAKLRKNTPLEFWSMYLVYLNVLTLFVTRIFIDFAAICRNVVSIECYFAAMWPLCCCYLSSFCGYVRAICRYVAAISTLFRRYLSISCRYFATICCDWSLFLVILIFFCCYSP
jgi:hypothetical protein